MAVAEILNSSTLKAFKQHGFRPKKTSGSSQAVGDCPFCGKSDKFFVNIKVKKWDCKSCLKNGGFQNWLKEIWEYSKKHFKGPIARSLVKEKTLDIITLKRAGMGYNPLISSYIIPIWEINGDKLHNLRIYRNDKLIGTSNCNSALYGWEQLDSVKTNIWLCEGHWDCLAMQEALNKSDRLTEIALAVPGAGTFKAEWTGFLQDCNINVLYDNDKAGFEGAIKVYNNLKGVCSKLNFIHWKSTHKDGFDIRDLWKKVKKDKHKFFRLINSSLKEQPQTNDEVETKITVSKRKEFKWKGKGLTPEKARAGFTKWLNLPNPYVIDILCATFIGNRLEGEPLWLFLVGQSGSGKSELIMSFDDVQNATSISSLTTKTLISGAVFAGGGDPSLIPRLDGRVVLMKDLTELFDTDMVSQGLIWGQLRNAYDGKAAKPYGNGTFRIYESKFGMIMGTTPIIEIKMEGMSAMGERCLRWNLPMIRGLEAEEAILRKAMSNTSKESQMRKELSNTAVAILDYDFKEIPKVPTIIQDKILYISQVIGRLRGTVFRDKYTKEINYMPFQELATRISKQLLKYITAIGMFRRLSIVGLEEYELIKHLALSSVQTKISYIVTNMYKKPGKIWTKDAVCNILRLSPITAERALEDLRLLNVLTRYGKRYGQKNWKFRPEIKQLISKSDLFV